MRCVGSTARNTTLAPTHRLRGQTQGEQVLRILVNAAIFVSIMLIGYALGIHPSLGEVILVILACAISDGVSEAL
jgi:hypothetical protein